MRFLENLAMLVLFTKSEKFPKKSFSEVYLMKQKVFRGLQLPSPAKTNYLVEGDKEKAK